MPSKADLVLLDACCVINLLATGVMQEILDALPYRFAVADLVLEWEVLHLREEPADGGEDAAPEVRLVTLEPLVASDRLDVLRAESDDEMETFVTLALQLDDGEALTAALAIHRQGIFASDDRKALRLVSEWDPPLAVCRTAFLVRRWAEETGTASHRIREVLLHIQQKASFMPPRDDPDRRWWIECVEKSEG